MVLEQGPGAFKSGVGGVGLFPSNLSPQVPRPV